MGRMERCPEKTGEQGAASAVKGDIMRFISPPVILLLMASRFAARRASVRASQK